MAKDSKEFKGLEIGEFITLAGGSGEGKSTSLRNMPLESTFYIIPNDKKPVAKGSKPLDFDKLVAAMKTGNKENLTFKDFGNYVQRVPLNMIEYKANSFKYLPNGTKEKVLKDEKVKGISDWIAILNKLPFCKFVVIEDAKHFTNSTKFSPEFKALGAAGNTARSRYQDLGYALFNNLVISELRPDITRIVVTHTTERTDSNGNVQLIPDLASSMANKDMNLNEYCEFVFFTTVDQEAERLSDAYKFLTNSFGNITSAKTKLGYFDEKYIPNDMWEVIKVIAEKN